MGEEVPARTTRVRSFRLNQSLEKRACLLHEGDTGCYSPNGHEVAKVLALLIQAASRREST